MTTEFWVGLIIALTANVAAIAASWGGINARLKSLETKIEKYNNFGERMARQEGCQRETERRLEVLERKGE